MSGDSGAFPDNDQQGCCHGEGKVFYRSPRQSFMVEAMFGCRQLFTYTASFHLGAKFNYVDGERTL